jgi:hypothetical protein
MSTATTRPPATVARSTVTTLARVEARRLLTHPVLLVGALITAALQTQTLWTAPTPAWATETAALIGAAWFAMTGATFVVANLAALRERETTTAEAFRAVPTALGDRTLALLLAGAVPTAMAAVVSGYVAVLAARIGGVPVGDAGGRGRFDLSLVEIASPVVITAAVFAAGVATARAIPSRAVGALTGTIGSVAVVLTSWAWSWFPAAFLVPQSVAARGTTDLGPHPTPDDLDQARLLDRPDTYDASWHAVEVEVDRVAWHGLYMVGIALLMSGFALARVERSGRSRWLLVVGALLAVAGFALQVWSTGQTFSWFEPVSAG